MKTAMEYTACILIAASIFIMATKVGTAVTMWILRPSLEKMIDEEINKQVGRLMQTAIIEALKNESR